MPRQIGVSITPGWTELTRTLSRICAHSMATALENRRTPPLVAQYPARLGEPLSPARDEILTIEPPPPARIKGRPCFTPRNTPSRLIDSCLRQSARLISVIGPEIAIPALLTST